jgi:hypothetical protein
MQLTKTEVSRLARLESTILAGLQQFIDVGNALVEIREAKLYQDQYETFEAYCRQKWGMSKTHANRLILGAQAVHQLGNIEVRPSAEAQIRPLTKVPESERGAAWARAVTAAGGRRPTAAQVQEAVSGVVIASRVTAAVPRGVVFVQRVRLLHDFRKWAVTQHLTADSVEKIVQWLSEQL